MALLWTFVLLLTPLLAAQNQEEPDPSTSGEPQETERCQQPQWDSRLHFTPEQRFYRFNEEVTLSCFVEDPPPLAVIRCANGMSPGWKDAWEVKDIQGTWHVVAESLTCTTGTCPKPQWDERLWFPSNKKNYRLNEELTLTCPGDLKPSFPKVKCAREFLQVSSGEPVYGDAWWGRNSTGAWTHIVKAVECIETCQRPSWDQRLQLAPDQENYKKNEEVRLSCPKGFQPSFTEIKCSGKVQPISYGNPVYSDPWLGRDITDDWIHIQSSVECIETCQRPLWDRRLQLAPDQENYKKDEEVRLSCPKGFQPSFTEIKCSGKVQPISYGNPVYSDPWLGRDITGDWIRIQSSVECIETCQRPSWDRRLQLAPDQENYKKNEEVRLSCPEGFQPSFTEIKCSGKVQPISYGNPVYSDPWLGRDITGDWIRIRSSVQCIDVLQVVPGTLEVSSTSIKLNWTCRLPDACQQVRARCRLEEHSSLSCEAEEVKGEETLHGQEGTFTCPPLQPFTDYNITISLLPSTILFTRLLRTKETVPDKPEKLRLDPSTGSLRWKALPSCKGEIIGYQLNVTARSAQDGSFLEMERLRLSGSVTEHPLPEHSPGSSYVVAVRGLTAAGAGAASLWEFQTDGSDAPRPLDTSCRGVRDISPSQGTAVLALHPVARAPAAAREHQLVVVATRNGTAVEGACSGDPQPFNASQLPSPYVAAVLNLSTPVDFVLGDGTHGQGYHNAALRPGWDYTALLRLVRRSQQADRFTCVCYSFSLVQEPVPLLNRMPVVMAVALVIAFLALGILLLFMLFRRKYDSSKTSENSSTIPLRRCRGGVCKLNTQIPVEELLEALKRFKREEIEAEQTEDESVDRHGAGRLREYQQLSSTLLHPCDAGKELCNQSKNRYKSIIPYDHCRVVLQPSDMGNGYINASYVDSYQSPRFFIAAQGPLPGTMVDFWQMVWQEKTSIIVMLTGLVEQNKTKCEQYWPEQEQVYGDFTVTLSNTRTTTGLVTRIFCLQKAGCALPRVVEQFHYMLWPDHGVPRNPAQLLALVDVVNKRGLEVPTGPVLVHCSAGIGRTGTFIALDFLLKMGKAEGKVDVFHCVQRLREQRVSMVQTKEQYTFLYEVLLEGLLCGSTGVPVENITSYVHHLREAETSRHNNVLEKEFKALQKFSELFQLLPCREAEKPSNQPKNRKPGILPADSCRPILMSSLNADGSPGYINAVFASTYTQEDRLIVTQLPFLTTLVDFWALVWDYTCTSVVVLNQLQELDKTYVEFWPTQGEAAYGRFHVHLVSEEPGVSFTAWTFALTNRQQPKKSALEVRFWQLKDWPMKQRLPPQPATIISLLGKVETHHRQSQDGHILVTCWDGASRSGIFCAATFLCEQIQSEGLVDVSQAVRMLKRRRRQLIKDVVGQDGKTRARAIAWTVPAAALAPLCSDHPGASRNR
ncbi:receptor-type tyrosine-protein phosphatase kappa-like isoform X5 [Accipiter gentilis]|uniref:receptor-type tyrosine-protein phosphatase kappa-like isoform X5 n=1 Tax=Astur gentilis TaxID=8957 RepID=UPI00210FE5D9|nr:receptor-type tyrosine-protein phosphatase kappa-like isoform X5 [Accipiter gentilis]